MLKKRKFAPIYQEYLSGPLLLPRYKRLSIAFLAIVISGSIGWVYEFVVACLESGALTFRGGNFLPWMNIYAFGALLVIPATRSFRKNPFLVFLISSLVAGVVELASGWLIFTLGDGARFWNYNHGLWAFGNINGFVCPLSMVIFGILALLLVYLVLPTLICLAQNLEKRTLLALAIILFLLVVADEATNQALAALNRPTAREFYSSLGLNMDKS